MPSAPIVRVEPRQANAAARVLSASHRAYPAHVAMFPDPHRRARAMRSFWRMTFADAARFGDAFAVVDRGAFVAAAVWRPPERNTWSAVRQLRGTPRLLGTVAADPANAGAFLRFGARAAEWPLGDAWLLETLGVVPWAVGTGAGAALMRAGLERVDAAGAECRVRTGDPAIARFYERFGFEVDRDDVQLVDVGPPHTTLVRERRGWHANRPVARASG